MQTNIHKLYGTRFEILSEYLDKRVNEIIRIVTSIDEVITDSSTSDYDKIKDYYQQLESILILLYEYDSIAKKLSARLTKVHHKGYIDDEYCDRMKHCFKTISERFKRLYLTNYRLGDKIHEILTKNEDIQE